VHVTGYESGTTNWHVCPEDNFKHRGHISTAVHLPLVLWLEADM